MSKVLKPKKLDIGYTIGIVAPSQPVLDKEGLKRGITILKKWGFKIKEGKTLRMEKWWMAGTPQDQAKEINNIYSDDHVKAIIAQAGGASAIKVLPFLDYDIIKRNPKPFIGMSDNNAYHLAMFSKVKLAGAFI